MLFLKLKVEYKDKLKGIKTNINLGYVDFFLQIYYYHKIKIRFIQGLSKII